MVKVPLQNHCTYCKAVYAAKPFAQQGFHNRYITQF